jgi:dihydrolipoamide dehydrogenase
MSNNFDLVVLGSGPGGYSAAFRAADLGLKVALVEQYDVLGGVCLNVGCIPSKALLHIAEIANSCDEMAAKGLGFQKFNPDADALRAWKNKIIKQLTTGLGGMAKMRKVTVIKGYGKFKDANTIEVNDNDKLSEVSFKNAIIAVGSKAIKLPFLPDDERVLDSTSALELRKIDGSMLVLGGGIIGCEMATVYNSLGTKVTIIEMADQLMPGADKDLVNPCMKLLQKRGVEVVLSSKVNTVMAADSGLQVTYTDSSGKEITQEFDQLLASVGRSPNGKLINATAAGVHVDDRGFIPVDKKLNTNISHIKAIGDVVGQPMLAHKAVPEGRIAAEIIAGKNVKFDALCIPSVAYTDPEVAWVGLTEQQAREQGVKFKKGVFPWAASGRALAMGRSEGFTKLIVEAETGRVIGGGIVGVHAGDLIAEIALAIEMCADVEDLALTIHPHPTLVESIMMAAEVIEGTATDLPPAK